ncbi:MAG: hypothetical protein OXK76_12055 [Gammaproteobacteria bacterium]|nr:hypothetical protein [Gammaproteobacteria bacterium]
MDYNEVFGPWRDSFGKVAVHPLQTNQHRESLLVHFLSQMGIHDERLFRAATRLRRENSRLGAKDVEIRRMVGVELACRGVEQWQRHIVMRRLGDLTKILHDDWPFAGLTRDEVSAFNGHFAESNARFARDYGIDNNRILFRDDLPPDFDKRGRPASWEDFSDLERRAVRRHVSRTVGIDIENANHSGRRLTPPRLDLLSRRRNSVGMAFLLRTWRRGTLVLGHAMRLTRALAQIRLSKEGVVFFARWVRWEGHEFWRRRLGALR